MLGLTYCVCRLVSHFHMGEQKRKCDDPIISTKEQEINSRVPVLENIPFGKCGTAVVCCGVVSA